MPKANLLGKDATSPQNVIGKARRFFLHRLPLIVSLLSLTGFLWIFHLLAKDGLRTSAEEFFYKPFEGELSPEILAAYATHPRLLDCRPSGDGCNEYTAQLRTTGLSQLADSDQLRLQLSPREAACEIVSSQIVLREFAGGPVIAEFKGGKSTNYGGGFRLNFERVSSKGPVSLAEGTAELTILCKSLPPIVLTTLLVAEIPRGPQLGLELPQGPGAIRFALLEGGYRLGKEGHTVYSRAALLAQMWGFSTSKSWIIYAWCALAATCWSAGVPLFLSRAPAALGLSRLTSLSIAAGCGLMLLAVLSLYALLVPPFHGQDEADHFLGFAEVTGRPAITSGALSLANESHFERIKRRPEEKFSSASADAPRDDVWGPEIGATTPNRSPFGSMIWSYLGYANTTNHTGLALLFLRWSNAVAVSLVLIFTLYFCWRATSCPSVGLWYFASAFLVPSVGFVAVMVSNYPYLLAGYFMQAVALGLLWNSVTKEKCDARIGQSACFLAGIGAATSLTSADNGMVGLFFWALLLPVYQLVGGQRSCLGYSRGIRQAMSNIGWFAAGITLVILLVSLFSNRGEFLPMHLADRLAERAKFVLPSSLSSVAFILFYLIATASLVLATRIVAESTAFTRLSPALEAISIGSVALLLITVLVSDSNPVQSVSGFASPLKYASAVVYAFADSLVPGNMDMMTVETFWRRLGWLDIWLPPGLIEVLRTMTALGLVLLFVDCLRDRSATLFAFLCLVAVAASVAFTAVLYHAIGNDVTSRYATAYFIFTMVLSAEGYRRFFAVRFSPRAAHAGAVMFCLAVVAVQTVTLTTVMDRFFGKPRPINTEYFRRS